jgi:cobalt-zinc-cadmium efflux system outer membrane protein
MVFLLVSSWFLGAQTAVTPDTTRIALKDAEDMFIKNNYLLLAQKYNVDASKALTRQAGLLNNPNLYYENSIHNRYSNRYFPTSLGTMGDASTQGEFIVQYNWLFSIAGKRNKSVKVAKARADAEQFQFDDLIRTLLFALRTDFYTIKYGVESLKIIDEQIGTMGNTISEFEGLYQKGSVSLREITRMRALLFSLQNDRLSLVTSLEQTQNELRLLLNNPKFTWYLPIFDEQEISQKYNTEGLSLSDAINQALGNRPDLKAYQAAFQASQANINLQKAIGVPDITIQGVFDRNGSYIPNYNGVAIGIPLVLFNRNQGNIKAAQYNSSSAEMELKQKQLAVQSDVTSTYSKILNTEKMYSSLSASFLTDFNSLLRGARQNYEKKNISLIEFVDLFETYKQSMTQFYDIKARRLNNFEELNYHVGKDIFKK